MSYPYNEADLYNLATRSAHSEAKAKDYTRNILIKHLYIDHGIGIMELMRRFQLPRKTLKEILKKE